MTTTQHDPTAPAAATIRTPDGPFTVLVSGARVLASGWTEDVPSLVALVHASLRPELAEVRILDGGAKRTDADREGVDAALDAVDAFYAGDLAAPGRIAVRQRSGEFREHAWDVLRAVAPGERITYAEYAARADRPRAVRAAAGACALNAAALFVPCHRVLRTDGSLGGFRYGVRVKERLLEREGAATGHPFELAANGAAARAARAHAPALF